MPYGGLTDFSSGRARDEHIVGTPRVIRDAATGDMITVSERRAEHTAGARGPRCLVFSTDRGFIRLWEYPGNWMTLGDAELIALSEYRLNRRERSA